MIDFTGRTAVVTGAAAGIGAATARAFAAAGANVVLADIEASANEKTAAAIAKATGAATLGLACDVADDRACQALVEESARRFGAIHILVNNAAIVAKGTVLDLDPDDFDRVLRINLRSAFVLTQLVARRMVEDGVKGAIVNISSLNSILAIANQLAYVTSKGGLQQLTKACALGLAEHGIRVNAVGPGSIMTDILKQVMTDEQTRRTILSRTPLGRVGEPDEISSIVVFLASDMASYITGETIIADGGRAALNYTAPIRDR